MAKVAEKARKEEIFIFVSIYIRSFIQEYVFIAYHECRAPRVTQGHTAFLTLLPFRCFMLSSLKAKGILVALLHRPG